jgi:hypothetical protein
LSTATFGCTGRRPANSTVLVLSSTAASHREYGANGLPKYLRKLPAAQQGLLTLGRSRCHRRLPLNRMVPTITGLTSSTDRPNPFRNRRRHGFGSLGCIFRRCIDQSRLLPEVNTPAVSTRAAHPRGGGRGLWGCFDAVEPDQYTLLAPQKMQ